MIFDPVGFAVGKTADLLLDLAKREILRKSDAVAFLVKHGIVKLEDTFESVYVNTVATLLLEGKPHSLLALFQDRRVVEAFAEAWRTKSPVIFSEEAVRAVNVIASEDVFRQEGIEVRHEVEYFQDVFRRLVRRAQTPGEQEVITRLDEILSEIRKVEAIPSLMTPFERFEQDLIGWLEAIGFAIEGRPTKSEDATELMLNIPRRRRGYDRVLVRAIRGEIRLSHVENLRESMRTASADEGWIITERRIAQSVRNQAEQLEHEHIAAYTLDELVEEYADFGHYFEWLEKQIEDKQIVKYYVPLSGTVDDLGREGQRTISSRYPDLDNYLDQWLASPDKEHISLLGEFGTGKTWFTLHYAYRMMLAYRESKAKGLPRPRIPLVIQLRNYAHGFKDVGALLAEFIFRQHQISLPGYKAFEQLNKMGRLLLIFDGFDEMAARVDRQKVVNNFWELARAVTPGSKAVLTCRTEHFQYARQEREVLSGELKASTDSIVLEAPKFEVLHLEMFGEEQVRDVLRRRDPSVVERIASNHDLMDMARRPVLIELILDGLEDVRAGKPVDMSHIYYYAVVHKMDRDISSKRTFTSLADKFYFLCELAWEMYTTNQMSLSYKQFPERIRTYFGLKVVDQEEDHWHYDLLGQTMLIRDAEGNYTPAHRSLLEFFVAYKMAAELGALPDEMVEALRRQSDIDLCLAPKVYTWTDYFHRQRNTLGEIAQIPPLAALVMEPKDQLQKTIWHQRDVDYPVALLLTEMISNSFVESLPSIDDADAIAVQFRQVRDDLLSVIPTDANATPVDLLTRVIENLQIILQVDRVLLWIGLRSSLISFSTQLPRIDYQTGSQGYAVSTGRSYLIHDVRNNPIYTSFDSAVNSEMSVPMIGHGNTFNGVISVESHKLNAFTDSDLMVLEVISQPLGAYMQVLGAFKESWQCSEQSQRIALVPGLLYSLFKDDAQVNGQRYSREKLVAMLRVIFERRLEDNA